MVTMLECKRSCPVSTQKVEERQGCGQSSWNSRLGQGDDGGGQQSSGQRVLPIKDVHRAFSNG